MNMFRWTLLLGLAVFLSACGGNDDKPTVTVTLEAPAEVASGTGASLKATVEGATAATVDFTIQDADTAFAPGVVAGADGSFTATSPAIDKATSFIAIAKDASGDELGRSEAKEVKISAPPAKPVATAKSATTLVRVNVVGGTPTTIPAGPATADVGKLAVPAGATAQLVAGSAVGGTATVQADGSFTFEPGAAGEASFNYEVVLAGVKSDPAKVTITVKDLPANTVVVSGDSAVTTINAQPEDATIIVGGPITCTTDPCITLKPGQKLLGGATVDGVELSPSAKLEGNRPNDGDLTTVIELAPDTTVEGIEIFGADVYTAINGVDNDLSGTINIKNVRIVGPTVDAPFTIRHVDGSDFGSFYNLNVEGLTVTNATSPIGISGFETLNFTKSTINMDIEYVAGDKEFGIDFHAYGDATATVDNVDITSAKANPEFAPMKFAQSSGGGVYNVTASNNDVSFGDGADVATANAYFFNYGNASATTGKIIISAASTGNTTEATSTGATKFSVAGGGAIATRIEGQVQVNGQLLPVAP